MRYFVIGDDGQKYGPADVLTLQAWVGEGRLLPNQQVEEEGSGIRMAAAAVNGLNFPDLAPPEPRMATPGPAYRGPAGGAPLPPAGSPYEQPPTARYTGDNGANDVTLAWVFAILGLLLCCVFDFPRLLLRKSCDVQREPRWKRAPDLLHRSDVLAGGRHSGIYPLSRYGCQTGCRARKGI